MGVIDLRSGTYHLLGALAALLGPVSVAFAGSQGQVEGRVINYGALGGGLSIEIAASLNVDEAPFDSTFIPNPGGEYELVLPDNTYYISAVIDLNDSGGPPDPGEPVAWYDADGDCNPDPVIIADGQDVKMVDIALGEIVFVDADASGANDGSCWANAFNSLQSGLAAAGSGSEIWVASGTYKPTDGTSRGATFSLKSGVEIHGGFAGNELLRQPRDWMSNATVLSGDIGTIDEDSDNSYHVVSALNVNSTAVLSAVVVRDGYADAAGGGTLVDQGGGMVVSDGSATVANVMFINNYAINHGGAMAVTNSAFPLVINCAFTGNRSNANGSALASLRFGNPQVVNSTFTGNTAPQGAVTILDFGGAALRNSIVWGNSGPELGDFSNNADFDVAYSLIETLSVEIGSAPPLGGPGNIDEDPLFIDADGSDDVFGTIDDDTRLDYDSRAIDAGDVLAVPSDIIDLDSDGDVTEPVSLDLFGRERFISEPDVLNTGNGPPPIIDMGAHEFLDPDRIFYSGMGDVDAGDAI